MASALHDAHIEVAPLTLRADVLPESIDKVARTASLVFSTGAPVTRYDWMSDTRYIETLSLKPAHVRLDRLNNSAPLLNAHSSYALSDVVGVVEPGSAKLVNGRGVATVRFSNRADVGPVWQDVQDGIIRNVSVGYRVHKYEQTEGEEKIPTRLATDWEPFEISLVPMGADDGAKVRSRNKKDTNPCVIVTRTKETAMADETRVDTTEREERHPELNVDDPGAAHEQNGNGAQRDEAVVSDRQAGVEAERERIQGITLAVRHARFPASMADKLIAEGVSLVAARGLVLEELGRQDERDTSRIPAGVREYGAKVLNDPNTNVWRGIENALLHRAAPGYFKLEEVGRNYRGLSMLEVAKVCLQARGIRTTGLSKMDIAGKALGLDSRGAYHTTSDFPTILADVANKTLRRAYDEAPQTFTGFARRVSLPDFKSVKRLQIGEAPALLKVLEHGEYTRGTIGEGKEEFALDSYGRVFAITRKALVNDDTDAFSRITTMFGRAARDLESNLVWEQITSNPVMGDGITLFHASHGNLSGTSDAISVASIGAGRAAMRLQRGLDGVQRINITARYLAVPVGKETLADQFVSVNMMAAEFGNVNPFAGKFQVLAEPRLDDNSVTAWYLIASSDQIDTVEYGFLEGEEGPVVESRLGFDVDGLEIKCRHDFAAKVIDHRGMFKNLGA